MERFINPESIATALVIAIIFAFVKLFRDVDHLRIATEPLVEWWKKTSLDALRLATNPISKRLTELADKYVATVTGEAKRGEEITTREKQELIDGLREIMRDPNQNASKRQSASMSLRFIETREGLTSKAANSANH